MILHLLSSRLEWLVPLCVLATFGLSDCASKLYVNLVLLSAVHMYEVGFRIHLINNQIRKTSKLVKNCNSIPEVDRSPTRSL